MTVVVTTHLAFGIGSKMASKPTKKRYANGMSAEFYAKKLKSAEAQIVSLKKDLIRQRVDARVLKSSTWRVEQMGSGSHASRLEQRRLVADIIEQRDSARERIRILEGKLANPNINETIRILEGKLAKYKRPPANSVLILFHF